MFISDLSKTIVAPSTPQGFGAIAIIRISGKNAFDIASKFFYPKAAFLNPKPKQSYLLKAMDGKKLIDQTVVLFQTSPKSYTGDNTVEIFCHGSPFIIGKIIALAIKNGAKEAAPGEFTMRAFINGKMDLIQAEAIDDLIHSESEASHSAAINQLKGDISLKIKKMKIKMLDLLSEIEVRLDDDDDEISELDFKNFTVKTKKIENEIRILAESFEKGKFIKNGFKTSIIGAPNSGKSSLLNSMLGYKRAIVTKISGTTTDTIEEKINLDGIAFIFTDTAGINPASKNSIEKEGILRTIDAIKTSDILIWVVDSSKKIRNLDKAVEIQINKHMDAKKTKLIKVFNKTDLKSARRRETGAMFVSCKTNAGVDNLKKAIIKKQERIFSDQSSSIITSMRHYQALQSSLSEIILLNKALKNKIFKMELAAEHLKASLNELSDILGETTSEDLLSNIFSKFCVGK